MSSNHDNRHTQIDFETLGGLKPRFQTPGFHSRLKNKAKPSSYRPVSERDAVNVSVTKRTRSPDGDADNSMTGQKHLQLPEAVKFGVRAYKYMRMKHESPWKSYEKFY